MFSFKLLSNNSFLRHNLVFFVGSLLVAVLNYLFYPVMGRLMNVADFGETQTLISIFLQLTILFTVTSTIVTNLVTNSQVNPVNYVVIKEIERLVLGIAIGLFILVLFFASTIQHFFRFDSVLPIYALGVVLLITFPLTISQAYLRGYQEFISVTLGGIVAAGGKLILAGVLVYLGWQTFGAMIGLVLAQLLALIYSQWQINQSGHKYGQIFHQKSANFQLIFSELKYAGFVLVVTLVITLLISIDVLIAKRFFSPDEAGLYAGIATVARTLYFLTASVSAVLLSNVKLHQKFRQNQSWLIFSALLLCGLGGSVLIIFSLWPEFFISSLMGTKYLGLANLLPQLSLAIFLLSISNLFLTYCLSLRLYKVILPTLVSFGLAIGLLLFDHQSLSDIVRNLLIGSAILLTFISLWLGRETWVTNKTQSL